MIVRRAAFEEVGLFDERFFVYAEDTEWCDRARRAGWEIYYCPQFSVYHYLGGSSKADPDEVPQSTLWLKSLDLYLRLRYGLKKSDRTGKYRGSGHDDAIGAIRWGLSAAPQAPRPW